MAHKIPYAVKAFVFFLNFQQYLPLIGEMNDYKTTNTLLQTMEAIMATELVIHREDSSVPIV